MGVEMVHTGVGKAACRAPRRHDMHLFMTSGPAPAAGTAPRARDGGEMILTRYSYTPLRVLPAERRRRRHVDGCSVSVTLYMVVPK